MSGYRADSCGSESQEELHLRQFGRSLMVLEAVQTS